MVLITGLPDRPPSPAGAATAQTSSLPALRRTEEVASPRSLPRPTSASALRYALSDAEKERILSLPIDGVPLRQALSLNPPSPRYKAKLSVSLDVAPTTVGGPPTPREPPKLPEPADVQTSYLFTARRRRLESKLEVRAIRTSASAGALGSNGGCGWHGGSSMGSRPATASSTSSSRRPLFGSTPHAKADRGRATRAGLPTPLLLTEAEHRSFDVFRSKHDARYHSHRPL